MTREPIETAPYSVLAAGYDLVMAHVDYESWSEYVVHLIRTHSDFSDDARVLELGCGTGSMSLLLARHGYRKVRATDRSPEMIAVARRKAEEEGLAVDFGVEDFTAQRFDGPYDVILLLYDGLNYVLEYDDMRRLFASCHSRMSDGGVFIFDQSTPSNSINNEPYFEDEGAEGAFRYVRKSRYESTSRLHTTTLDMHVDDRVFRESHVQRAYERGEIEPIVREAGLEIVKTYDGFSLDSARGSSERIHWVVRRSR